MKRDGYLGVRGFLRWSAEQKYKCTFCRSMGNRMLIPNSVIIMLAMSSDDMVKLRDTGCVPRPVGGMLSALNASLPRR